MPVSADDPYTISVPIKLIINIDRKAFPDRATTLGGAINLPRVDPIGDGVWGQTNSPKLGTAARPAGRTTRGATQRKPQLGGGDQHTIILMPDKTLWGATKEKRLLGGGLLGDKLADIINKNSEIKWIVQN